jgi:rfaE bifunctional protein nucleotidyltransferase chain/domain
MHAADDSLRHPAVLGKPELLKILEPRRRAGEKIVFTNGCYDILHPGHARLLESARALGDVLVLGLNSDDSVRRLEKGPERPLNSFAARAFVLAHLSAVDFIVEFDEDTPLDLIREIRPDILVKGGDWPLETIVGADFVAATGGRVQTLPLLPGFSTTALVQKIRSRPPTPL